jgi:hypothetical protein
MGSSFLLLLADRYRPQRDRWQGGSTMRRTMARTIPVPADHHCE